MTPRVLLLDAVGTLVRPEPAVAVAYAAAGARHGSRLREAELEPRFRAAFAAEEAIDAAEFQQRTDEARELRRWRSIVERTFNDLPADRIEPLFRDLWDHFARPASWRPFPETSEVLAALAARGTLLAVASNFDSRLYDIAAAILPQIPQNRVFVSSIVGVRKPDPAFFAACRAQLPAVGPEELLVVGDDLENDFLGTQACGLEAVLVDRRDRHPQITPRIGSLSELLSSFRRVAKSG